MALDRPFHSLEDFFASTISHVDGLLDDGWGASFPVKGREIEATVLFADFTALLDTDSGPESCCHLGLRAELL